MTPARWTAAAIVAVAVFAPAAAIALAGGWGALWIASLWIAVAAPVAAAVAFALAARGRWPRP